MLEHHQPMRKLLHGWERERVCPKQVCRGHVSPPVKKQAYKIENTYKCKIMNFTYQKENKEQ